ncbi:MAG: hypothetical protein GX538_08250, partial [Gammaproteobacteria bacterium]|nr:hypothetical protein [Gammaproteobacteria bacterium]
DGAGPVVVDASSAVLHTPDVANDPEVMRHTAVLGGLQPGTTYRYAIGDGASWGEEREFTTAPERGEGLASSTWAMPRTAWRPGANWCAARVPHTRRRPST